MIREASPPCIRDLYWCFAVAWCSRYPVLGGRGKVASRREGDLSGGLDMRSLAVVRQVHRMGPRLHNLEQSGGHTRLPEHSRNAAGGSNVLEAEPSIGEESLQGRQEHMRLTIRYHQGRDNRQPVPYVEAASSMPSLPPPQSFARESSARHSSQRPLPALLIQMCQKLVWCRRWSYAQARQ